jgi:hypothetical protein
VCGCVRVQGQRPNSARATPGSGGKLAVPKPVNLPSMKKVSTAWRGEGGRLGAARAYESDSGTDVLVGFATHSTLPPEGERERSAGVRWSAAGGWPRRGGCAMAAVQMYSTDARAEVGCGVVGVC